ncbi:MAG: C40 family peptidase [Lachnospiraceae bacterium]|nr:C40 family peptidase [Lachnospiraceae bacterium]
MKGRRYNRVFWCLGTAVLAGSLQTAAVYAAEPMAAIATVNPALMDEVETVQSGYLDIKNMWKVLSAESQYIEGLEEFSEYVLSTLQNQEEIAKREGELMLFQRAKSLAGTRVYANVTNYVNVRKEASTSSDVVGKLYADCVATVIEENGDWVYVNSGNVTGYVTKQFLLLADEAEAAIAKKYSPKIKVTANTLNIRSGAGTGYEVIGSFSLGAEAELLEQGAEWMKIRFTSNGEKKIGYVYAKYVTVTGEPKTGETLAEESARIAAEKAAAEKKAAEEAAAKKAAAEQAKRDKAKQVADYAKTAVGTAYVWGGTNLKTGVDCSGLCYAAYKAYGYTLPRVSRDMAASSALLSVTPNSTYLKAGDLVFYASGGRVDHVAMYIGDGKVVHASDYSTGVIISNYNYRTPHSAKRVIY